MVYGTEAVIPTKFSFPTARTALMEFRNNEEARLLDLNFVEERRAMTAIKMLAYQQKVAELNNKQIRKISFPVGDLVMRKMMANTKNPIDGQYKSTVQNPVNR